MNVGHVGRKQESEFPRIAAETSKGKGQAKQTTSRAEVSHNLGSWVKGGCNVGLGLEGESYIQAKKDPGNDQANFGVRNGLAGHFECDNIAFVVKYYLVV